MKAALCEYPLFFQQSTSIFPANQALIDALRLKHHPKKDLLTPELPETIFKTIQLKQQSQGILNATLSVKHVGQAAAGHSMQKEGLTSSSLPSQQFDRNFGWANCAI